MKRNPVSIRIANPCTEDWEKMTPTGSGKFCGSCQKNVTDFSAMTDNEILAFLENHTGSMCGQLRGSQLNRAIVQTRLSGNNYRLNTLLAALMVAGGAGSAMAQDTIPSPPEYHPTVVIDGKHPTGPVCIKVPGKKEKLVLKATLRDTLSDANVEGAIITIRGTNIGTETDEKGNFVLNIPDSLTGDSITLMCYNPGYFPEWTTIAVADIEKTSVIEVAFNEIMMKGDMIIEEEP